MQTAQLNKPPSRPPKQGRRDLGRLVATRKGAALVAAGSAVLAAIVLIVFLNQYTKSLGGGDKPVTVLVAKHVIEKGSSGTVLAEKSIFQTTQVRKDELKNGAIADPANLRGKVATDDIYPGEQLVISDFAPATGGVRDRISGNQRAISLPLDSAHGMIGDIQTGDHVDVFVDVGATGVGNNDRAVLATVIRNLFVLRAPKAAKTAGGPMNTQEVVLRATDAQAAQLAYASDTAKIWLVLRPKVGAANTRPDLIDKRALLLAGIPGAALAAKRGAR
jgi:pilus assembly protein CpaB